MSALDWLTNHPTISVVILAMSIGTLDGIVIGIYKIIQRKVTQGKNEI